MPALTPKRHKAMLKGRGTIKQLWKKGREKNLRGQNPGQKKRIYRIGMLKIIFEVVAS